MMMSGDNGENVAVSAGADDANNSNQSNGQNERQDDNATSQFGDFATELGCSVAQAADYAHELNDALHSVGLPSVSSDRSEHNNHSATKVNETPITPSSSSHHAQTAASILRSTHSSSSSTQQHRNIVSFSHPLDSLLGGGIPLSELTELVGLPGCGKTQLAMQLCVDARLSRKNGGVEGCSVVVDSEGSWTGVHGGERLWTMAKSLVEHVRNSAGRRMEARRARAADFGGGAVDEELVPAWFTPESILEGIHIFRVHDEPSQTCTLYSLPQFLMEQEEKGHPVKLLVIDSLAFHYRVANTSTSSNNNGGGGGSNNNRNNSLSNTHNLTRMSTFLTELASEFDMAVVALNHLTTKIEKDENGNSTTKLVPALGESWAHSVTSRLMIDHYHRVNNGSTLPIEMEEARVCTLVKSPHKPPGTALFAITNKGIRGVPSQALRQNQGIEAKRQKII